MRVVVADDSMLLREGIARVLERHGHQVVGLAGDPAELAALVETEAPDVAIIDIRMPPTQSDEGIRAAAAIRSRHGPAIGLLILSQYLEAELAQDVVSDISGGVGYLLKERVADSKVFADAVRRVGAGEVVVDPEIVARLLRRRNRDPLVDLTDRELDVLGLIAEGRSNQAIGERLEIVTKTVETHVNAIFSKLGLGRADEDNRRVLAVLAFLRQRASVG
jgi:DNA-binding NarL/FixJ family response regulator